MFRQSLRKILNGSPQIVSHPQKLITRTAKTKAFARKNGRIFRRKMSTEKNTKKSNLKSQIAEELMKSFPDDLTKLKSFELKIVTKTFYMKTENF